METKELPHTHPKRIATLPPTTEMLGETMVDREENQKMRSMKTWTLHGHINSTVTRKRCWSADDLVEENYSPVGDKPLNKATDQKKS